MARPDPRGGRIQLEGAYMPAMAEARMLMLEHCGGRFEMHEDAKRGTVSFACVRPGAPTAPVVLAAR